MIAIPHREDEIQEAALTPGLMRQSRKIRPYVCPKNGKAGGSICCVILFHCKGDPHKDN